MRQKYTLGSLNGPLLEKAIQSTTRTHNRKSGVLNIFQYGIIYIHLIMFCFIIWGWSCSVVFHLTKIVSTRQRLKILTLKVIVPATSFFGGGVSESKTISPTSCIIIHKHSRRLCKIMYLYSKHSAIEKYIQHVLLCNLFYCFKEN